MSTFLELVTLDRTRPGLTAPVGQIAAWHEAKARLHEHFAAEGGPEAAQEMAWAASAHEYARRLLPDIAA